ncbi:MAG: YafY family protein [Chloroflexota bacterium]
MYHPATRVLTVLELLQTYGSMNGPELAARLEVDVRTVRRYVTMLQDLGIPVESARGRYGAYRLRPGFKLPPLMFTEDEALALVLGLLASRSLNMTLDAPAFEGALAKIERVMPETLRQRVQAVQEMLVLDTHGAEAASVSDLVVPFSLAAQQHRQLWIEYTSGQDAVTQRMIEPYGVVYREGRWYAVGYCRLREDIRVFRLDRVLTAQLQDTHFDPPADFDSLAYLLDSIVQIKSTWQVEVLLTLPWEEARRRIPATLGTVEQTSDGVHLQCFMEDLEWIAYFLIDLRCPFVVYRPAELRDVLRQVAAQIVASAETITPKGENKCMAQHRN